MVINLTKSSGQYLKWVKMEKVILFDLDGTVIDSTDAITGTFLYSFEQNNFDFRGGVNAIHDLIGYPLEYMFENLGVPKENVTKFVDTYKQRYKIISIEQTYLIDGAKDAIKKASKFARLGVVTTKTTKYTIPILEHLALDTYFETLIGRQEVVNPKPHPEPILKALELMNIDKNKYEVYMIGDTKLDLISANSAGIHSTGVLTGYGKKSELEKYTEHVFNNLTDAIKYLENK